jgi:hypothetical protein
MNFAILLASLLIGANDGDVSAPTENDANPPGISRPTDSAPLEAQPKKTTEKKSGRPARPSPQKGARSPGKSETGRQSGTLPTAPTDNDSDTDQPYRWLAPTAEMPGGSSQATGGRPMGFYGPSRMPTSPTRARPGQAQSISSMRDAQLQQMRIESLRQSVMPSAQQPTKAFAGASTNSGGVSPYMNLFRNGTDGGTIDNYSTLVRPALDQRRTNQQFNTEINALDVNSRVQGLRIQQLNRETNSLQGVKAQQYFMNYGDYYQSAR